MVTTRSKTVADKQKELEELLKKDAALHAKIARAASGLLGAVTREAVIAALGEPPPPKAKGAA